MREEEQSEATRRQLIEQLRALEGVNAVDPVADLAYQNAREALERAIEEARSVRLRAIEDARSTRERELSSLMESMKALRDSAEEQIGGLLRSAEIEAARIQDQARHEAAELRAQAQNDASQIRAEAAALRASAEQQALEVENLQAEFNRIVAKLAKRLGIKDEPAGGWWQHLTGRM